MGEEAVYLISTCHREIYKQSIYQTLAYPAGLVMHFKYRREGVPNKVWESDKLCGKEVIVVAALKANHLDGVDLYPLRKGKILETDRVGSVFHVYFETSDTWVDYPTNDLPLERTDDWVDISQHELPIEKLEAETGYWNDIDYIQYRNDGDVSFTQNNVWSSIVSILSDRKEFSGDLFYKVDGIFRIFSEEGRRTSEERTEDITNNKKAFVLRSKKTYEIDILFDFGTEPPEVASQGNIEFVTSENLSIFPQTVSSGFLMDKRRPTISTGHHPYPSIEHISIEVDEAIEGPNVTLPFKVKGHEG